MEPADILKLDRPLPSLLRYYRLSSLLWGPFFLIPLIERSLRFRTIRYQFDAEGVTMRWGGFARHEVSLAYGRIQDIHVSANLLERWFGLARLEIQTASGDAKAEMTLEGLPQPLAIRDFLYERSRGARALPGAAPADSSSAALTQALLETAGELRAIRALLTPPGEPVP